MGVSAYTPVFLALGMVTNGAPSIGVGPTVAQGEGATPELVQKIDARVVEGLRTDGTTVSAVGLGCTDVECVVAAARGGKLAGALTVRIDESVNDYVVAVELRGTQDSSVVITESQDLSLIHI